MMKKYVFGLIMISVLGCNNNKSKSGVGTVEKWKNGKLKKEVLYIKDSSEYMIVNYYENGKVQSKVRYSYGLMNGPCVYWYDNGTLSDSTVYSEGDVLYKLEKYPDGRPQQEMKVYFTDSTVYYDQNGKWNRAEKYIFSDSKKYSVTGKLLEETKVKGDTMFFYVNQKDSLILDAYKVKDKPLIQVKN